MLPDHTIRNTVDAALGTAGFTSPFWLDLLDRGAQTITLVGGAILIIMRLYFAYHEWQAHRNAANHTVMHKGDDSGCS